MRKYNVFLKVNSSQINPFQVHISNLFLQPALLARPPQSSVFPCPSLTPASLGVSLKLWKLSHHLCTTVYTLWLFVQSYSKQEIFSSKFFTFKSQVVSQDDFPWT